MPDIASVRGVLVLVSVLHFESNKPPTLPLPTSSVSLATNLRKWRATIIPIILYAADQVFFSVMKESLEGTQALVQKHLAV